MERFVMSLDSGTTSARCVLFGDQCCVRASVQRPIRQSYPKSGWVEQDPEEIYQAQLITANMAIERLGITHGQIEAIGICNQRSTIVIWDSRTLQPIYPAIVWQCRRTEDFCAEIASQGELITRKTGVMLDASFPATKIRWVLNNVEGAMAKARAGRLRAGTIDAWLLAKLTGGEVYATEASNASFTMLYNLAELKWDRDLLDMFEIPDTMMPEVVDSIMEKGSAVTEALGGRIPITAMAGDQQAALFGHRCFRAGQAKATYGTSCCVLMNTGAQPVSSRNGMSAIIAWSIDGTPAYALEGTVFSAGATLEWLKNSLGLYENIQELNRMLADCEDTAGCCFIPAFSGLASPYWEPGARGSIFGLTQFVEKKHLIRAAIECIAFQAHDCLEAMRRDGMGLTRLCVDGGISQNDFLMQFQSDLIQCELLRPANLETSAEGVALMAGIGSGFWRMDDNFFTENQKERIFLPRMDDARRREHLSRWKKAIDSTLYWAK